ncbi:hypothetical protein CEXT_74741 [Caerostris extrusa]|uniref:Uncharacterized protein n=1 Tax=Caerostris extrusa TaxID=172846 RepID=A0AAV4T9P6_CAEEX|nr:hypothetical protein CEXT_74741 [Caerostris extrusa]
MSLVQWLLKSPPKACSSVKSDTQWSRKCVLDTCLPLSRPELVRQHKGSGRQVVLTGFYVVLSKSDAKSSFPLLLFVIPGVSYKKGHSALRRPPPQITSNKLHSRIGKASPKITKGLTLEPNCIHSLKCDCPLFSTKVSRWNGRPIIADHVGRITAFRD